MGGWGLVGVRLGFGWGSVGVGWVWLGVGWRGGGGPEKTDAAAKLYSQTPPQNAQPLPQPTALTMLNFTPCVLSIAGDSITSLWRRKAGHARWSSG
jgi:hypothetical protein